MKPAIVILIIEIALLSTADFLTAQPGASAHSRMAAQSKSSSTRGRLERSAAPPCDQGPLNPPVAAMSNLDHDAADWGIYCEGIPAWVIEDVTTPSLDGKALRCGITGGVAYSNVHCYRNLLPAPLATSFRLTLTFLFSPTTTFNNQGGDATIQAIEFTMNTWRQSKRYEFALQWQNVGLGAPQWRYWDPHATPDRWVALGITDQPVLLLAGNTWHSFELVGEIVNGQAHYRRFVIDSHEYQLTQVADPAIEPGSPDLLAVAVQLDGNATATPYDLLIDQVHFTSMPYRRFLPLVLR